MRWVPIPGSKAMRVAPVAPQCGQVTFIEHRGHERGNPPGGGAAICIGTGADGNPAGTPVTTTGAGAEVWNSNSSPGFLPAGTCTCTIPEPVFTCIMSPPLTPAGTTTFMIIGVGVATGSAI